MLIIAEALKEIQFGKLMALYREGNREKAVDCWPRLDEIEGIIQAENDFYQYLRQGFFRTPGVYYCIWEVGSVYASALRLEPYQDGLLLEALETAPELRRQGFGENLVRAVLERFGDRKIYSHVSKRNIPSLHLHEKCGFRRILDHAVYVDGSVNTRCDTLLFER